jgi:hypothetical protein
MQCKDIPDEVFLDAIRTASRLRGGGWAMYWDVGCVLTGHDEHVGDLNAHHAFTPSECMPGNLIRAKAKKLIDRRRMDGCPCGCRGDFEVLDANGVPERYEMKKRGSFYVAPIGTGAPTTLELGSEWKEMGWMSSDGVATVPAQETTWLGPNATELIRPMRMTTKELNLEFGKAREALRAMVGNVKLSLGLTQALAMPTIADLDRMAAMRTAYRRKRRGRW